MDGLVRLVTESWLDGCLGEGAAADHAASAAGAATEHELARSLWAIANDERRHTALAWSILEWAIPELHTGVREAVASLLKAERGAAPSNEPTGLEAAGRLGKQARDAATDRCRKRSRARVARLMSSC